MTSSVRPTTIDGEGRSVGGDSGVVVEVRRTGLGCTGVQRGSKWGGTNARVSSGTRGGGRYVVINY
ncbi:hypothetical protein [Haladaptatus pallidirubidus]|uniref:hypothetical protein n=1 Tax=Haladaptatus pallidirubidus TaxID=1008152 RepID=UPI001D12FB2A|nr:hypothetical protein [Haladaptatus pallidirubidus]